MAELQTKTCGLCFESARACARKVVLLTLLSRISRFFASVQRPRMVSPARWITASKPETDSGEIGCVGFHGICCSSEDEYFLALRTSREMRAPLDFNVGSSAVPIGPDIPLTRIRAMLRLTMRPTL